MILRGDHLMVDAYTARVLAQLDLRGAAERWRNRGAVRAACALEVLADDLDDLVRGSADGTIPPTGAGTDRHCTHDPDTAALRTEQAATLLDTSDRWVRELAARGELPGAQRDDTGRWRIPRDAVLSYHRTR
ncbi:hypothetical protein BH23ACT9_BH23ACT9_34110 [soil metagenome]